MEEQATSSADLLCSSIPCMHADVRIYFLMTSCYARASPYPTMSPEEILESILSGDTMPKGLLEHVSNDLWDVVKR